MKTGPVWYAESREHGGTETCGKGEGFTMLDIFDIPGPEMAGITSRIPADGVIDCMGDVGRRMPPELRETALVGLPATPFGKRVVERMEPGE